MIAHANKQLFLMGRYDSQGNWYGAGSTYKIHHPVHRLKLPSVKGSISRPVQLKKPIVLGAKGGSDGTWYVTRFEMIDNALTVISMARKVVPHKI
ncbi:hypothetical protein P4S72_06345 [Vibrio sp. PP-XX7]